MQDVTVVRVSGGNFTEYQRYLPFSRKVNLGFTTFQDVEIRASLVAYSSIAKRGLSIDCQDLAEVFLGGDNLPLFTCLRMVEAIKKEAVLSFDKDLTWFHSLYNEVYHKRLEPDGYPLWLNFFVDDHQEELDLYDLAEEMFVSPTIRKLFEPMPLRVKFQSPAQSILEHYFLAQYFPVIKVYLDWLSGDKQQYVIFWALAYSVQKVINQLAADFSDKTFILRRDLVFGLAASRLFGEENVDWNKILYLSPITPIRMTVDELRKEVLQLMEQLSQYPYLYL